jgi:UPF0755 protein
VAAGGLVLVAGLAAVWVLVSLFQPGKDQGTGAVTVQVPAGASTRQIGDLLADRGVVDSGFWFALRAKVAGRGRNLKPGRYRLQEGMGYMTVLDRLEQGPPAVRTVSVTIPEGRSIRETAPLVRQAGLRGSYLQAVERARGQVDPRTYGVSRLRSLEGFLFPSTYELRANASAADLVAKQLQAFKANFGKLDLRDARRRNLTGYDVLIVASMVEREAQLARERPIIAGIIYNRMRQGIPLGIDATTRYALNNWTRPLTTSDFPRSGAYNTRATQGLPPTPIGNPGLASLRAAAQPAQTDYLYYVVKPCGNGAHAFSSSYSQFLSDSAAYERERQRRGGDPSRC